MNEMTGGGRRTEESVDLAGMEEIAARVREISIENDRLFTRLLEGEKRFRQLAKAVWKVQEEERRRLALELHDGIGQTLTALKNHLQRQRARSEDPAVLSCLEQAYELAAVALADTRELSRLLRPPVLDDLGLRAALDWLVRIQRERAGLQVSLGWQVDGDRLDTDIETLVFRGVQEALTNVVKHAQAATANVVVEQRGAMLIVHVEDNGAGFDVNTAFHSGAGNDGFGLRGLRDRVELFGGRIEVESGRGAGSRLRLLLPVAGSDIEVVG